MEEDMDPDPAWDRNVWGILLTSFTFTFWQPAQIFSRDIWESSWYERIVKHTPILKELPIMLFPVMWYIIFITTATAWFLFWKNFEHLGEEYVTIQALIITTILTTKLWTLVVASIPWVPIFFFASLLTSGPATAVWILMFIHMGSSAVDIVIYFFWAPIVLWSIFATFGISISIWVGNSGVSFDDIKWGIYSKRSTYEKVE